MGCSKKDCGRKDIVWSVYGCVADLEVLTSCAGRNGGPEGVVEARGLIDAVLRW